jgi:hypothetical protein
MYCPSGVVMDPLMGAHHFCIPFIPSSLTIIHNSYNPSPHLLSLVFSLPLRVRLA